MSTTREGRAAWRIETRWVELVVALLIVALGALVVVTAMRVGIAWGDDGPQAGYFPFIIGCILTSPGAWIAGEDRLRMEASSRHGLRHARRAEARCCSMLLPTIAYVALIWFLGIYVASAIYIAAFMIWQGKYRWLPALGVSVGVPIALFLLFEIWFLVPLPKGPIEQLLGYLTRSRSPRTVRKVASWSRTSAI